MADFRATDAYSEIELRAITPAGIEWARKHAKSALRRSKHVTALATAPGYMMHVVLPEIRAAGLTVDGDIDEQGRATIRVRV